MIDIVFETGFYMIDTIAVDAIVRETHRFAGEATTHPVEEGGDVSDYYRPAPRAVQLEGVITDTPLRVPGSHNSGAQLTSKSVEVPGGSLGLRLGPIVLPFNAPPQQGSVQTFSATMERVKSTWEAFEEIFAQQKIITIVTSLRTYPDMALSELEVERKPGSYKFSCFATQIRTVASGRTQAAPIPKVTRAVPKVKKGNQQPKPEPSAPTKSLTAQLLDAKGALAKAFGFGS